MSQIQQALSVGLIGPHQAAFAPAFKPRRLPCEGAEEEDNNQLALFSGNKIQISNPPLSNRQKSGTFISPPAPWAIKCDIRRYFPSIDHRILRGQIGRVIGDSEVLALIDLILASHIERTETRWPEDGELFDSIACPKGLPIGNLTSQFFANIYLDGFDHFVKQTLRARGYVRYVDDFLIFGGSRAEVRARGEAAREYLHGLRLEIHPDKYRSVRCADGVDFCGFVVRADGRVKVRESGVRRFNRRYRKLRREAKRGRVPVAEVTRSVRAWVAHAEHAQSWGLPR